MLLNDRVFRQHGFPMAIISDRDHRFTEKFWTSIFKCLADDWTCPQRVIRRPIIKLSELIASSASSQYRCCIAKDLKLDAPLKNAAHAITGFNPFNVNSLTYPRVPPTLPLRGQGLVGKRLPTSSLISAIPLCRNKGASFSRCALVSYAMCVMQWLIAKMNRKRS